MKTMNDVNAVYDQGLKTLKNGLMVCPVCEKTYQNELAARRHVDKRDCYKMQDIIGGTVHETKAYGLYKELIAAMSPKAQISISTFRKSPMYGPVSRFTMFCSLHEVYDSNSYLAYLNEVVKIEQVNTLLKAGLDEQHLREFRVYAHKYDLIPSDKYYDNYRDDLLTDDEFLVRSIEKARVGLTFLAMRDDFPFEERFSKLPIDYQNRISAIADEIL